MFRSLATAAAVLIAATAAQASDIVVKDAYARSSNQKNGAAFMVIENHGDEDDRLVAARSDMARKVELHAHAITDGVARMRPVEGGVPVPAHGAATLRRGGLHVMFMGISSPFRQGERFPLTLVFEKAGEVVVDTVVDNERRAGQGGMKHGATTSGGAASD